MAVFDDFKKKAGEIRNETPSSQAKVAAQPQQTNWYKGAQPTARETGAQVFRVGMQDPSQQAELNRLFQLELDNPNGPIYQPYRKATTTSYTKTNLQNTQKAKIEQAGLQDELSYWAGRSDLNLSDDEIINRINWKNYPTLAKMDEQAALGTPMALVEGIGYSKDAMYGILWAARNPGQSTGDALYDSIQGQLGRGNQFKANDVNGWRDATSDSYAPYKAGATALDDLAYKYRMDGAFDMDWLNTQGRALLNGDEQMKKDYNRIYQVVAQTDKLGAELQKYRAEVNAAIASGLDPRAVFYEGMMEEEYPELYKAYEGQRSGKLTETSRALDFDFESDVLAMQNAYQKKTGTMDDADFADDVAVMLGLPTLNNEAQRAVTRQTNEQLQAAGSIFAKDFTPAESAAMYTASAGYMPTKQQLVQSILNGTAGDNEAYTSAMDAANAYASEFWLNSVNTLKQLEAEKEAMAKYAAFDKKWAEKLEADPFNAQFDPEYMAENEAIQPAVSVAEKYGFDMAAIDAAIENEKKVQANILKKFSDAERLNTNGQSSGSVMPLLTFVNEFSNYEGGQRYANTTWGEQLRKGESWDKVSKSIADQEKNNVQLLRMIETALRQAGEHGLNSDYTKGLMAFRDELIGETELMQYDKLRGNADFESTVKNFSVPSNTNPILMVIDDPETFYRTADEQTLAFGAPVSRMTDAEKETYKYVYATQGPEAAADYYSRLEPMLNVRMSEEAEAQAKEDADNAWFGGTVMSALANLGGAYSMFDNALKTLSGQEVDPYGVNFLGQRYSQTVREEVKKNIDENFGEWADVLKLGYDVLATGLDQGAALAMGGGQEFFTLALQSGAAGNASLMDAYLMGGNDIQAWGKAGIATLAEYLTEKGPLGDLFDAFANGGTGAFKETLKRRMIAEGGGEFLSEAINTISDNVIMQELSQYNALVEQYMAEGYTEKLAKRMADIDTATNILYSGFLGAVSSAPTTAVSYAAGALNKRKQNKFKSRAEAALSKAQSDGAGKPAQAAAMAAAMEAGGSNPEDADAAASAMAQTDPQATYTLWSVLEHSNEFDAVPAVELGALVPDSQTGNLFAMIKEEGATEENVAQLIETANQEMADPEVKAKYDAAIASYEEGSATMGAMLGADLSGIKNAQKNAENASRTLQTARTSLGAARASMKSASTVLQNAQKRFSNDHGDKATAAVIKAKEKYQKAQQALEGAKQAESSAQKDYDAAKAELETVKQNTLAEIRQQGVTARDQIMANRQAVQEQQAAEAEAKREADNALSLEADNFVNAYFDTAPEDVKADIKERYMTYDGETRKVTRDMSSFASQISKKFNLSIKFTDSHSIFEGAYTGGNQIVLDKNATQGDVIKRVLVHEITHAAETSNVYNELADAVLEAYYGDNKKQIEVDIEAKSKQYAEAAGQDGTDIARSELVAERLAEMLSGNQEAMDRLVAEKPAVATRIWRAIKEFIGKMTGVQNSELDKFIQLEKKLEKALGSRDADKAGAIRFNKKDDFLFNPDGKTFDELLDDVLSDEIEPKEKYLPIGRFTESFVAEFQKKGINIADLPILMNYKDAYISIKSKDQGRYKGNNINYHDLGKDGFKQAIRSLDRPVAGLISKNPGKIELVLPTTDKKGNLTLAIFELNTSTRYGGMLEAHIVPTVYGRRSIDNYIAKAEMEGRLVFDKRKEAPQGTAQVQYEGGINAASEESIAQPGIKVNLSIPSDSGEPAAEIIRGGATKFSLTSWNEKEKETVRNNLVKNGYDPDSVDKWISDVNSVSAIIAADKDRLDYKAADNQVMLKNNQEYVKTLDASTLCAKRLLYQGTFNAIQHELPNTVLTSEDLLHLSDMMNQVGLETPCGVCYVESRRRHLGKFAQEWLDSYDGEYKPTLDEVTTTDGLEALRHSHPEAYQSFVDTMNSKGSANPKVVQLRTDYRGDVRDLTKSQIEKIVKIGGLRVQSFSDFETPHLIDMMQAVLDMSGKKLTSQAYTKVPNFAWVFGDTGIKINLSLLAEGNGLNEDGTLRFSSKEGMNIDEAMRLRERYSENVGTILVGVSEEHIRAAMADPRIDYIIPFHKSGWGQNELNLLPVLNSYDNFEDYQNERTIEGYRKNGKPKYGKPKGGNFYPIDYWDYDKSGDENAATYLRMCEKDGRVPKFEQFLEKDSEGHWVAPSGYWKMLIDFKMYDNDGNKAPQKPVQPNFNMEEAVRVLNEYDGGADSLPVAWNIVGQFVAEKKKNAAPGTRFSLTSVGSKVQDEAYMNAVNASDEESQIRLLDQVAEKAGYEGMYYHGSDAFGFTEFDLDRMDDEQSIFVTNSPHVAGTYTANDELKNIGNADSNGGIYQLYVKKGKTLVVDAEGKRWNELEPPYEMAQDLMRSVRYNATLDYEEYGESDYEYGDEQEFKTRDITDWAKRNGYDSVTFENIIDNGSHTDEDFDHTSTVVVVFDPKNVKSADLITYDDNGRVIPPSKRFSDSNDIRFSLPSPDILNRQMAAYRESQQMDIPEGMGQRQFAGQTVQNSSAVPEEYKPTFMMPENLFYEKDTNREQVERAWQRIQQNGFEAEYNRLLEKEDVYDADDTAEANLMMAMALNPNTSDPAVFMSLALRYNEKGTENAQALQARQLFKKMTPTGAQVWVAGKAEKDLKERRRTHQPEAKMVDDAAQVVADSIKDKQGGDELLRLTSGGDFTIDASNNKWGIPLNEQQKALIDQYGLNEVNRPGLFYNRATVKQRMLEAIIATPNPLEVTGLGLNLIQRLEHMKRGEAVVTNADLNYIGARLGEFIGAGEEAGGRAAELALARAYEAYGNIKPATGWEKFRAQRYTNMLLSAPSVIRNVIGNALQNTMNAAAHGTAVEVDKIISKFTGKRTLDHLTVKERADGWAAFVEETKNTFRDYYVDRANTAPNREKYSTSQRGRVYNNGIQEGMRNLENFLMSVGDRNVWKKAFVNSLAEQQRLADQGLLFNTDGTTMTHEQMVEQAEKDANYATFTEDNAVQELMGALAQKHPRIADVISVYLPFTGVPSNIVKRSLQFSPVGLAYTLGKWGVDKATHKNFDQRAFVNNLSRGLTGTGLMVAGALLAKFGMIKLGTEDEDGNKAYDAATAMGEQYTPYFYDPFTDTYVSMSTFAPALSPLVWGTAVMEALKGDEDAANALLNSLMYSTDSIFDASYLSGFSDIFGGQGSFTENLINAGLSNITSQMVPAMITQLANATDPYVRNTKDKNKITEMLKITASKIPGLRQMLPEKVDVAGDTVRTKGWWSFIDPFTRTNPSKNEALIEANRLYDLTGDTSVLPSDLLRSRTNTLNVGGGKKLILENHDKEWYQKRYGELWTTALMELMNSPKYARMDDDERAEALKKILSDAMSQAKKEAWAKYGSDE